MARGWLARDGRGELIGIDRAHRAHRAFLASNPVLNGSFHTHDRFGWLEFVR